MEGNIMHETKNESLSTANMPYLNYNMILLTLSLIMTITPYIVVVMVRLIHLGGNGMNWEISCNLFFDFCVDFIFVFGIIGLSLFALTLCLRVTLRVLEILTSDMEENLEKSSTKKEKESFEKVGDKIVFNSPQRK